MRNCAGAEVLSPGPSKTMVRRELASVSTGVIAGEGVLFSLSLSMIAKRENEKKAEKQSEKKM